MISKSDEEDNAQGYDRGLYTFMHCQEANCHNLYWKGKNGATCTICEK